MAVTIDDVRARVETDLDDDTVQRILDAAVEDLSRHAGSPTSDVETVRSVGRRVLSLPRRHSAITKIEERRTLDSDAVELSTDDWRATGDYELFRLANGTNPALTWGREVVVTYTPAVDADLRDRVVLDLCQMDIEFRALKSERSGDYTADYGDYEQRRCAVIGQVREGRSLVL